MRVLNNKSLLLLLLVFLSQLLNLSAVRAAYIPIECVSGECSLDLRVNDNDINKVFPEAYPGFRIQLDTDSLLVPSSKSEHFKILVYNQTSSGVQPISTHNVAIPGKLSRRKNTVLILDIPQFIGTRTFWMDVYRTNGTLSSTYRVALNAYGTASPSKQSSTAAIYGQSLNSLISPQLGANFPNSVLNSTVCPNNNFNECNLQELFFHKFSVEASTVQDPNKTSILKESDGTFKLRVPVVASRKSRQERLSSSLRDSFISAEDPELVPDPSLVNNQPVTLSQVDELNLGSSIVTNFSIDEVSDELELRVANAANPLVLRANNIAFNGNNPRATLDLELNDTNNKPSLRFANSPLISPVRNGSFEFDGTGLFFTSNGVREYIMQSTTQQLAANANQANVKALLAGNADTLDSKDSLFFQNASNFNAGTVDLARLPANLQIVRLFNENISNSLTLRGADNIVLTSQVDATLNLPTALTGTLATLADLATVLGPNTVSTTHILDNNLLAEDFSNGAVTDLKISSLDAADISTGLLSPARLPNHEISNVNNLSTALADRLEIPDVIDNLSSFSIDKGLSANQGRVLKNLIDALPQGFTTVNQNLLTNVIDFSKYHSVFKKTLSPATVFSATNLKQGHRAYLILRGDAPSFPSFFNLIEGSYNPESINIVNLEVITASGPSPRVNMKIVNLPLVDLLLSVRKVNPAYNGPAIRVRRDSDNAELDIYFTNNGNLDTAALISFTGTASGYVSKWYDQSLSAYHVEQSVPSLQPQIVSAGTLLLSDNALPAIVFTDDFLQNTSFQIADAFSFLTVAASTEIPQDENNNYIFSQGSPSAGTIKGFYFEDDSDIAVANGFSSQAVVPSTLALNNSYLFSYVYNKSNLSSRLYVDSVLKNTASLPVSNPPDTLPFIVGRNSAANNSYAAMRIQEIRIYNRSLADTVRQSLETNIDNYFNLF